MVPAARLRLCKLRLVQQPAGDDGGLDDERDHVDDLVDHALVPLERRRALPQPRQALQQLLVARRAQVVILGLDAVVVVHAAGVELVARLLAGAAAVQDAAVLAVAQQRRRRAVVGLARAAAQPGLARAVAGGLEADVERRGGRRDDGEEEQGGGGGGDNDPRAQPQPREAPAARHPPGRLQISHYTHKHNTNPTQPLSSSLFVVTAAAPRLQQLQSVYFAATAPPPPASR